MLPRNEKYAVYVHTAPNGKRYVGITSREPNKRWDSGWGYQSNKHFFRAIKKYGWKNITHEILFEGLSSEDALAKERELINRYETYNPKYGYNKTEGEWGCARAGWHHTDEAKDKIARAMSTRTVHESTKEKLRDAMKGMYGPEHYKKMHNMRKTDYYRGNDNHMTGRFGAAHHNATAVRQIDILTGEVLATYGGVAEAARAVGICRGHIGSVCNGNRQTTGGYKWQYADK